jgi:hypothetical protein
VKQGKPSAASAISAVKKKKLIAKARKGEKSCYAVE